MVLNYPRSRSVKTTTNCPIESADSPTRKIKGDLKKLRYYLVASFVGDLDRMKNAAEMAPNMTASMMMNSNVELIEVPSIGVPEP